MRIGRLVTRNPFVLAPMDGYTDAAMRRMCRRAGAGLCFTEMVPAQALVRGATRAGMGPVGGPDRSRGANVRLRIAPDDHPVVVQVVGNDPDTMAEAARMAEDAGADAVDVNAGCPSRRVTNGGSGAALLSDLTRLERILRAVRVAIQVPLTLKVRIGPTLDRVVLPDIARMTADCGVDAVTLHARTRAQRFSGRADWTWIARLRERATIPVIGNGDVRSAEDALRMMRETGCDGVMVGRAAVGGPWIFTQMVAAWEGRPVPEAPRGRDRSTLVLDHFDALVSTLDGDESRSARLFRKHLARYVRGLPGALRVRRGLASLNDRAGLVALLQEVLGG